MWPTLLAAGSYIQPWAYKGFEPMTSVILQQHSKLLSYEATEDRAYDFSVGRSMPLAEFSIKFH